MPNDQRNNGKAASASTGEWPIIISGAGPVGLILSIMLSRQGIRHLVVEKRSGVGTLPRARGINIRTVEIFSQAGLKQQLDAITVAPDWTRRIAYAESIAGDLIGAVPIESMAADFKSDFSPCCYQMAAQDRLDPMLYEAARSYPEAEIRFDTEVLGYKDSADGIVTIVRNPNGTASHLRSAYLVAADGGKSPLRTMAGIDVTKQHTVGFGLNTIIHADLKRFSSGKESALLYIMGAGLQGLIQILNDDGKWAVQLPYDPQRYEAGIWTEERALATIRTMIGHPSAEDLDIEIENTYTYTISMGISERLREGRLLLTGDAAHQFPPYGGFGLNTGLQTAHNLAWKLGAVLRGEASDALLDTYERERLEVADRVHNFAVTNHGYVLQLAAAVRNAASAEERKRIVESAKQYGNCLGLDVGVHYDCDGAFVHDDVAPPAVEDPVIDFVQHAKPGHRAPHFWAKRRVDGERVSSVMLSDRTFVLLAGAEGANWVDSANEAGLAPKIAAYRVAPGGDLEPEVDFCALYGIDPTGAVLIRPDGHVAFRSASLPADPSATLRSVIDQVLQRHVTTAAPSVVSAPAATVGELVGIGILEEVRELD